MALFCSTIIPTVGRNTLAGAVSSVLKQDFDRAEVEVIVVNDSGKPLPVEDWQQLPQVQVINTCRRERCVARNSGAAIARGQYLHFLDDDDILLPGAMTAFWELHEASDAVWLYGSYQNVDNDGNVVARWCPDIAGDILALLVAGEGIPFQASLLQSEHFHAVGTFDPSPKIVGVEDRDVGRRVAFAGQVAYTPAVVAQIRIGQEGSTTNWATLAESDRWGREKVLRLEGAGTRLRISANTPGLRGRVCRAYLASAMWNLKRRAGLAAASRLAAALSFTGIAIFTVDFWSGLRTKQR